MSAACIIPSAQASFCIPVKSRQEYKTERTIGITVLFGNQGTIHCRRAIWMWRMMLCSQMGNYIWKMILHGGPARQPFFHPKHKSTSMLNEKKESMWGDRFAWNFNPSHSNLVTHQRAFTGRPRLWIKPKTLVDRISAVSDLRILKVKWRHINTNRNTFLIAIPRFKKKTANERKKGWTLAPALPHKKPLNFWHTTTIRMRKMLFAQLLCSANSTNDQIWSICLVAMPFFPHIFAIT